MASTHRGTGRAKSNPDKIVIPNGVGNSLLERLSAEMGDTVLQEIPKEAVSAKMLAQANGLSEITTGKFLMSEERAGRLKKIRVKVPGQRLPQAFYVAA